MVIFLYLAKPVWAGQPINAYLFYGEGCPHCAKERQFLQQLETKYPDLRVTELEIYYNQKNSLLMQNVARLLGADAGGVPFLVIGNKYIIGYAEGIYSREIETRVAECLKNDCGDIVAPLMGQPAATLLPAVSPEPLPAPAAADQSGEKFVNLPLVGPVDLAVFSLPVLTVILAMIDGFNPCAMWTLMFLISLLLGMKDRRRMWILGTAFIAASALVYWLFMAAWLNLFLFLGVIVWVRLAVGIVALGAGGYYLYDYWVNRLGACRVSGQANRQRVFARLKDITQNRQFLLALGGIILLAFAVNLVELVCSAGLPAVYTQVLSLSQLPQWQYHGYLALYIFIFMLDDLFIFFTAMITLRAVGLESKYSRFSHLIGGWLMLVIGGLLLFKPEWLMFG